MPVQNSIKNKLISDLIQGKTIAIPLDSDITVIITMKNNKIKRKLYFKNINKLDKKYENVMLFPYIVN